MFAWEQLILQSLNLSFLEHDDATKKHNRPRIPYAQLKHKLLKHRGKLMPNCAKDQIGGYQPITLA